jgi:hypothetical protein
MDFIVSVFRSEENAVAKCRASEADEREERGDDGNVEHSAGL